jgi:hypothetical protein
MEPADIRLAYPLSPTEVVAELIALCVVEHSYVLTRHVCGEQVN